MYPLLFLLYTIAAASHTEAFSVSRPPQQQQPVGNILILDHLNINHEKGRHDWLKAFYFDFLNCAVDPRKEENLLQGRKTLWANIGANQFHLPEGKPDAQIVNGIITLSYQNLSAVQDRYEKVKHQLQGTQFALRVVDESLAVTDPWGNSFRIVQGDPAELDARGLQLGSEEKDGLALRDLTIYTSQGCNMQGIARFYEEIMGAPVLHNSAQSVVVSVGPRQTLSFVTSPAGKAAISHVDLRDDQMEPPSGYPSFLSNYGPHISIYLADFCECYTKADALNLVYVNPRFKRQAYTLDQAIDDCMFRIIDIIDPDQPEAGAIMRLEHEVRGVVKRNGDKYGSCPFNEIPDVCRYTLP